MDDPAPLPPPDPPDEAPDLGPSPAPRSGSDDDRRPTTAALSPELRAALAEVDALRRRVEKEKKKRKKAESKADKGPGSSRGIETMFRTSYRTHMDLSGLADTKANIMISINGIIVSILLASLAPRIQDDPRLLVPAVVLLAGCVTSIVYAVRAARPRVTRRPVSLDDVREGRSNILFFGNFVGMEEEEYVEGMHELMADTDRLYTNMIRDLYSLGGVLLTKFRLLRVSYTVFMVALVVGVGLFVVVLALGAGDAGLVVP